MKTRHTIIEGDSRQMSEVQSQSVHLIITSPPYWQLKDYGNADQIGYDQNYETYINHLNLVWQECYRVLHEGCRLCINIGDQFARAVYYGRYKVIPIRTEIIKFCESIGFDYMGAIIWQKKTTTNTTGGASLMGSYPHPRNGILSIDYEFILLFKKMGTPPKVAPDIKKQSAMTKEEWKTYFSGHWNFRGAKQDGHIAMFPLELPYRLIKMFSFVGETVLDPFLGSGTTSLAAQKAGRNSIGYEINPDFIPLIRKKLNADQPDLYGTSFQFLKSPLPQKSELQKRITQLPYIFKDPHQFNKKTDPKKLNFGSRIDNKEQKPKEEYFSIKKIISPEKLLLDNSLTIRLIGIKTKPETAQKAVEFLTKKLQNQKVFLRFDQKKHDNDNNLLCYLYLKNKTFINAHLLKKGLVETDDSYPFKYRSKFLAYKKTLHG